LVLKEEREEISSPLFIWPEEIMANIQHKDIPEAQLHEPKGASTSTSGQVLVSSGGASTWGDMADIATTGATAGQSFIADGSGGGTWKLEQAYGEMEIIQNSTGQVLTAASDSTLYTNSDYVLMTQWVAGETGGVTYAANGLTVPTTGEYTLASWFNQTSSINNVLVGVKFAVNGVIPTAGTVPTLRRKIGTGADVGSLSGSKLVSLTAGDTVTLYIACDSNATITTSDAVIDLSMVKAS
jgi:hypothetical protein